MQLAHRSSLVYSRAPMIFSYSWITQYMHVAIVYYAIWDDC